MKPLQRAVATLIATGLAAVALVGCGSDEPDDTAGQGAISVSPGDEGADASDDGAGADLLAGALAAIALAEDETGGTAYEIDDSDGGWEVEVAVEGSQVDVRTDLAGTEVRSTGRDDEVDDEDRAALRAATITLREAIETAVAEVPGTFEDAELDEEGDGFAWEVTVDDGGTDREVHVDVVGGAVIRVGEG